MSMKHLSLDPRSQKAADTFCGLINTAASVFMLHLSLGGAYQYTEHHSEILDLLRKLVTIIDPYESKHIDV